MFCLITFCLLSLLQEPLSLQVVLSFGIFLDVGRTVVSVYSIKSFNFEGAFLFRRGRWLIQKVWWAVTTHFQVRVKYRLILPLFDPNVSEIKIKMCLRREKLVCENRSSKAGFVSNWWVHFGRDWFNSWFSVRLLIYIRLLFLELLFLAFVSDSGCFRQLHLNSSVVTN